MNALFGNCKVRTLAKESLLLVKTRYQDESTDCESRDKKLAELGRWRSWDGGGVATVAALGRCQCWDGASVGTPKWWSWDGGGVGTTEPNPYGASLCLTFHSIAFLKIISYAHVNHWYRTNNKQVEKRKIRKPSTEISDLTNNQTIRYPENLTIGDMYYFLIAPTLCYDLNFPRNPRVRKLFVLKRLFEVIFLFQIILALNQQWIVPLLKNSLQPFISMDYGRILERLLKLAIPNHVIWLLAFYWLFHSFLNLVAELLRFADRRFYNDWWNAETVQYFWQNWNMPVHKWCVRHLYVPMVSYGYGKVQASCTVFIVSAFFHEYLISIPLHLFRLWSFSGMLAQIPLNILTKYVFKGRAGNIVVWLSLILGQPLAILMYVHDWYVTRRFLKEDKRHHVLRGHYTSTDKIW
uniref:diacylglycerol O-acyltransferase n=1 Tax=Romanomermis culicivorax TaxID=13658 RepID=A0A915JR64_ROMCU